MKKRSVDGGRMAGFAFPFPSAHAAAPA
jgi:hypothetical protein